MYKKILVLSIIVFSLFINAKIIKKYIIFNNDYNTLIEKYNNNYIYNFNSGFPILPARRIFFEFDAQIDSFSFTPIKIDTFNNFIPIIGENPLLKIQKINSKSTLKNIQSLYPSSLYDFEIGKRNNHNILYGKINNFRYIDNTLFSIQEGVLKIYLNDNTTHTKPLLSPSMLIITLDSLKSYWTEYQKLYPNIHCIIKSDSDIISYYPSLPIQQSIRTYLQQLYADSNLIATLIALDTDKIPGLYLYLLITPQLDSTHQLLITDKYYSCLDGNWNYDNDSIIGEIEDSIDIFPDILLSRAPLNNGNDINNFINKIKSIRTFPSDTILFVSSFLDNNTDGSYATDNIIKITNTQQPIKKLYEKDNNLSSSTFIQAINNSPFAIMHVGHGNSSSIQSGTDYTLLTNLDTLKNVYPPLLYSVSCWSAAYDYDCVAEHYLLSPGGGFYVGNSRYGWYTPYFPGFGTGDLYALNFFNYFLNSIHNPAQALNNVFSDFAYQINHFNDYRWQFFCITYFGDPLINMDRDINYVNIDFEKTVKNHFLNFTIPIKDSLIAYIKTDNDSFTQLLSYNNNLFSCSIDSSESIFISLHSYSYTDTSFYIYPLDDSISCNLTDYNFDINNDTLILHAYIDIITPGNYIIKVSDINDTLIGVNNDTIFSLSNDTILDFKFLILNNITNNTIIPIKIDNYNIKIQTGFYFLNNISYTLIPDKIHYVENDTIKLNLSIKNTGLVDYDNIYIILNSDSILYNDTIFIPTLYTKEKFDTFSTLIANNSNNKINIHSTIQNNYSKKSLEYFISVNNDNAFFDFENGNSFIVDSQNAYFHLTNNDAFSGSLCFYSGFSYIDSYPSSYITTLYSDYFYYDTTCYLGFATKYNTEAGFDYCIVFIEQDSNKVPIRTLDGNSNDWEEYVLIPPKNILQQNTPSRLVFSFYSETDDIQYNGWYIDNVLLPSKNIISQNDNLNIKDNIILKNNIFKNTVEFVINNNKQYTYKIYNISGQFVSKGIISKSKNKIFIKKSGKYFIFLNKNIFPVTIIQ